MLAILLVCRLHPPLLSPSVCGATAGAEVLAWHRSHLPSLIPSSLFHIGQLGHVGSTCVERLSPDGQCAS